MTRSAPRLLALLLLAGCAGSPANPSTEPRPTWPVGNPPVVSACDVHGNRLYTVPGYERHVLAVVGQDPTCKETRQ